MTTVNQQVNKIYKPIFTDNSKRYFLLMGGRAGGRSFTASQYALAKLIAPEYYRAAIMRYVSSDIRNSIYREIYDRIEEQGLIDNIDIREQPIGFKYGNNRIDGIGFRKSSTDHKSKLKSLANYTDVIIEEADEVSEEDFIMLDDSIRTTKSNVKIILLFNPPHRNHWIVNRWFNLIESEQEGYYKAELKESAKKDTIYLPATYKDNIQNLALTTIENYENYKNTNPDHYWNMVRGYISEGARGRVYKHWNVISAKEYDELPYPVYYGLDFGFSNHEAALAEIKEHNKKVYCKELIYDTGLTNQALSRRFTQLGISKSDIIYADSAEPKSIEELRQAGWSVEPSTKGKDSVNAGIDMLLDREVFYTEDSTNIALEIQNYKWKLDRNKLPTNKPIDEFDHLMDAIRYGVFTKNYSSQYIGFA